MNGYGPRREIRIPCIHSGALRETGILYTYSIFRLPWNTCEYNIHTTRTSAGHTSLHEIDSGSHKVQHFFNAISLKIKANLLTIDGPPENSSDLERAAAARSIADEFSGGPSIVNALQRCENTRFHIHTAPFGIRSLLPPS